jgi:hypothetical protein
LGFFDFSSAIGSSKNVRAACSNGAAASGTLTAR